ncbi:ankyrin repeat-containing protein ITN1-like [Mangifera indica]|uniref:ankyrin repeat-containing protein ITN1-like n=1 Tax=Mangifera indica TaxID=29780 RepID=UPI001CF985D4|nr:ankyrin repeat-containing protein ITN1-like [Mangifera indica]
MEIQAEEAAQNDTQMLYEASMRGCVATLNTLIQNDPIILHKISLTRFTETPLHISALLGHVEFTKAIVSQKPQLVTELDSFKRSPLHLAAAEGHGEIVKELLIANKDVRGENSSPFGCNEREILVSSVDDEEFLNSKNLQGNSILQVSVILQQYETISKLLSVPKIRVDLNSLTKNGFPAFDGICRNGTIQRNLQNNLIKETTTKAKTIQAPQIFKSIITSFSKWRRLSKHKSDRYEGTRGNLMVVATLIATMSFQIATNPPSGYWQEDTDHSKAKTCPKGEICRAGTAIHAYTDEYYYLTIASTVSFSASLSIILWLISGVALRNRVSVGILVVKMWISVLFIANAYFSSFILVIPNVVSLSHPAFEAFSQVWAWSLVAIIFMHAIRLCWWVLKKLIFVAKWCCFKKKKQLDQPVVSV